MAASKTARSASGVGLGLTTWWAALAKLKVCRAVTQSANSLLVGKRATRRAAA